MPERVARLLVPHLEDAIRPSSLCLVTSTSSTPANWLLVRLLYIALSGIDDGHSGKLQQEVGSPEQSPHVVFVSLLRPLELWIELCKKAGLDLNPNIKNGKLHYIDALVPHFPARRAQDNVHELKGLGLAAISSAIRMASTPSSHESQASSAKPTIIIDGLDFILASQSSADLSAVQRFISQLRSDANAVILTCSADTPLLHNQDGSATPLEQNHAAFISSAAHQGSWVMQLRGLDTGTAKDITGVLRISKGGSYSDNSESDATLDDVEWLYQAKGDGSARVWSRGE